MFEYKTAQCLRVRGSGEVKISLLPVSQRSFLETVTDLIGWQCLKHFHCLVKIFHDLLLRQVIGVTFRLQRTDTSAVFVPLVHPQIQVIAAEVLPVL